MQLAVICLLHICNIRAAYINIHAAQMDVPAAYVQHVHSACAHTSSVRNTLAARNNIHAAHMYMSAAYVQHVAGMSTAHVHTHAAFVILLQLIIIPMQHI